MPAALLVRRWAPDSGGTAGVVRQWLVSVRCRLCVVGPLVSPPAHIVSRSYGFVHLCGERWWQVKAGKGRQGKDVL